MGRNNLFGLVTASSSESAHFTFMKGMEEVELIEGGVRIRPSLLNLPEGEDDYTITYIITLG